MTPKQQQMTPEQMEALKKKLESMTPEQIQEMVKQQCIFCKIVGKEAQAFTVYEDKKVLAFLDIQPATAGHVVVIPKKHYSVLPQMPDDEVGHLFAVAKSLAGVVFDTVGAQGVTIMQNNGAVAGQTVPHVRVHVIPRFPEDKLQLGWKPQKLSEADFAGMQNSIASRAQGIKVTASSGSKAPASKPAETKPEPAPRQKFRKPTKRMSVRLVKP